MPRLKCDVRTRLGVFARGLEVKIVERDPHGYAVIELSSMPTLTITERVPTAVLDGDLRVVA